MRRFILWCMILIVLALPIMRSPVASADNGTVTIPKWYSTTHKDKYHLAYVTYTPGQTAKPWIVVIHGGAWMHGDPADMNAASEIFANNGYTVFNISYPLLNPNGEQAGLPKVDWQTQKESLFEALNWIRSTSTTWGINRDRGAIFGYSAGGHMALTLGLYGDGGRGIKAIVTASGAVSPSRIARAASGHLSSPYEQPTNYNKNIYYIVRLATGCSYSQIQTSTWCESHWRGFTPQNYATPHDPPVLLWSGTSDVVIPYGSGGEVAYYLRSKGVNAEARYLNGLSHTYLTALGTTANQQAYTLQWLKDRV